MLLVTHSKDSATTSLVEAALAAQGARSVVLHTDQYPTEVRISSWQSGREFESTLTLGDQVFPLNQLRAAWYRRMHAAHQLPPEMPPSFRHAAAEESKRTLVGLLATLPCFILDPFQTVRRAACKQHQLAMARHVGLKTPRTLITNDPQAAKAFVDSCANGAIAKMQSAVGIPMNNGLNAVPTTRIRPEHHHSLSSLVNCPMMFQTRIEKQLELRVAVVGRRTFTAAIDSNILPDGTDDWRRDAYHALKLWKPFRLPKEIDRKIHRLMDHYGLNYGGIDIIVTPENEYYFLEINPGGEFHWLDQCTGLPIGKSLAEVLLGSAPRRLSPEQHPIVLNGTR